jgi:hypothetical protein
MNGAGALRTPVWPDFSKLPAAVAIKAHAASLDWTPAATRVF